MKDFPHDWAPTTSLENLHLKARLLADIRTFFAKRNILEVETPLLCAASVTDPYLHSLKTTCFINGKTNPLTLYLQTSPEFGMKRLLAAGSGSIYQICKAFRDGDNGRYHNPEFTILEWYHVGFDHFDLISELNELLHHVLGFPEAEQLTYANLFQQFLGFDPHTATLAFLKKTAADFNLVDMDEIKLENRDDWLNLLLSHLIEPQLGVEKPLFVYDFPASQAALAKIRQDVIPVAERFELYMNGMEIANGFHELTDAKEQQARFEDELRQRQQMKLPEVPIDYRLLSALHKGLPPCAGVALGIDRLLMVLSKTKQISEVLNFPVAIA